LPIDSDTTEIRNCNARDDWPRANAPDIHNIARRRALSDGCAGKCYTVTIPGRGYNFVAPVGIAEGPVLEGLIRDKVVSTDLYGEAQRHEVGGLFPLSSLTRIPEPCS